MASEVIEILKVLAAGWHYLATDWPDSGVPSHVSVYS